MKLSIPKPELQRALGRIQAIVEKRNSMPILANVLLDAQKDGEGLADRLARPISRSASAARTRPKVAKAGRAHRLRAQALRHRARASRRAGHARRRPPNSYLELHCGRARFSLAGTSAEEYPSLPEFPPSSSSGCPAAVLSVMIERTMYAASVGRDPLQPERRRTSRSTRTSGELRMVATDGHRLAHVDRAIGPDVSRASRAA